MAPLESVPSSHLIADHKDSLLRHLRTLEDTIYEIYRSGAIFEPDTLGPAADYLHDLEDMRARALVTLGNAKQMERTYYDALQRPNVPNTGKAVTKPVLISQSDTTPSIATTTEAGRSPGRENMSISHQSGKTANDSFMMTTPRTALAMRELDQIKDLKENIAKREERLAKVPDALTKLDASLRDLELERTILEDEANIAGPTSDGYSGLVHDLLDLAGERAEIEAQIARIRKCVPVSTKTVKKLGRELASLEARVSGSRRRGLNEPWERRPFRPAGFANDTISSEAEDRDGASAQAGLATKLTAFATVPDDDDADPTMTALPQYIDDSFKRTASHTTEEIVFATLADLNVTDHSVTTVAEDTVDTPEKTTPLTTEEIVLATVADTDIHDNSLTTVAKITDDAPANITLCLEGAVLDAISNANSQDRRKTISLPHTRGGPANISPASEHTVRADVTNAETGYRQRTITWKDIDEKSGKILLTTEEIVRSIKSLYIWMPRPLVGRGSRIAIRDPDPNIFGMCELVDGTFRHWDQIPSRPWITSAVSRRTTLGYDISERSGAEPQQAWGYKQWLEAQKIDTYTQFRDGNHRWLNRW